MIIMKINLCLIVLAVFGVCTADPLVRYQPEQIHLSLGGKLEFMLIKKLPLICKNKLLFRKFLPRMFRSESLENR